MRKYASGKRQEDAFSFSEGGGDTGTSLWTTRGQCLQGRSARQGKEDGKGENASRSLLASVPPLP